MARFSKPVIDGLVRRHQAAGMAEQDLRNYLLGALEQLGIDPQSYAGFDDATGEIKMNEESTDAPDPT